VTFKQVVLTTPIQALIPGNGKVVSVEKDASVGRALKVLADNRILSVPVADATVETGYAGFVDVLDIVGWLVTTCKDMNNIQPQKFIKSPVSELFDKSCKDHFVSIQDNEKMIDLLERFASGIHRVAIQNPKIIAIISQMDVIPFFLTHESKLYSIGNKTVKQLGLVKAWVLFVNEKERALKAYKKMVEHKVSAVAVTDSNDHLLDNLSASDLRGISSDKEEFSHLIQLPVLDFLAKRRGTKEHTLGSCSETETFLEALKKLKEHRYHRLWVVDRNNKPCGVISLTDVCAAIRDAAKEL